MLCDFGGHRSVSRLFDMYVETNKRIGVTMINEAFVPFTRSWLCNVASMEIASQVVIVATDLTAYKAIKGILPSELQFFEFKSLLLINFMI